MVFLWASAAPAADMSSVTLYWNVMPQAARYLIVIASDPEMTKIVTSGESARPTYVSPPLAAGQYYYYVQGYVGDTAVGRTEVERVVVGSPVLVLAKGQRLPAPEIIAPSHMESFTPGSDGHVRLAWQEIPGVKKYRFSLWEKEKYDRQGKDGRPPPARWTTDVEYTWLVVKDAPYTSFMYLDPGTYRWEIAGVDPRSGDAGQASVGYFVTAQDRYFPERQLVLRAHGGAAPNSQYEQRSTLTNKVISLSSRSTHYGLGIDYYHWRSWGVGVGVAYRTFKAVSENLSLMNFSLDLLKKHYLSDHRFGWWLGSHAGFGSQETPQVDALATTAGPLRAGKKATSGLRLGTRLVRNFASGFDFELPVAFLLHLSPMGPLDAALSARLFYNWGADFATGLDVTRSWLGVGYFPFSPTAKPGAVLSDYSFHFIAQFRMETRD